MRSARNKTIDFPLSEAEEYLSKCVKAQDVSRIEASSAVLGDAFDALKKIEDGSVDLLIADPPYNINKQFHGSAFKAVGDDEYAEFTEKWLSAALPKLKKDASVYVCCDWKSSLVIGNVLKKRLTLKNRITWQREKGRGASANWKNSMEDIFFATVSERYKFNLDAVKMKKRVYAPYRVDGAPKDWEDSEDGKYRFTCPSNFWDDIAVPYWSMAENTAHPTQKPEKLIAKIMLASSCENDLVLDPFAGSGTTAVVAKKLGRRYITIEQNPLYCAWTAKRLELAEKDPSIQGYQGGVFLDRNGRR